MKTQSGVSVCVWGGAGDVEESGGVVVVIELRPNPKQGI